MDQEHFFKKKYCILNTKEYICNINNEKVKIS